MLLRSHASLSLVLGLLAVAVFGGSLPATRVAVQGLDPWFVTAARAAIGGVVAAGWLAVGRPRFPREHVGTLALIALLLVAGFPAALAIAAVTVPAAHGGVVMGLMPLATAVAAVPLAGERPSPAFWTLSAIGAALVVAFAFREGSPDVALGDLCLGLAIVMTGTGYTLSALLSRTIPGWQVIAWALLLSFPPAALATFLLWPADAAAVPFPAWAGLLYGGVMAQFVGYALWNAALALGGVARIGQLQLLQTFFTFAAAALVLGEHVDAIMVGFAVAVAIVVALGRRAAIATRAG